MATEIVTSFGRQVDSSGIPLSGALVYVYDVGTTTLKSVWSDTGLSVSAANPIVCDAYGLHDMRYIATGSYKIVVKTSAGVTVYTRDNIDGRVPVGSGALSIANGGTGQTSAAAALNALGGVDAATVADLEAEVASLSGTLASSEKTHIATGTTAQRPAVPAEGDIRRNTTTGEFEGYDDSSTWRNFITTENIASQTLVSANMPAGSVVSSDTATYATNTDLTTAIPLDDTVPQNTEGTQIISLSYTCKSTTNKLRVRFNAFGSTASSGLPIIAALFQDSTANALAVGMTQVPSVNSIVPLGFEHVYTPGTTSAITLKVRVGPSTGTMRLNGDSTARRFGGIGLARLVVEEIKA